MRVAVLGLGSAGSRHAENLCGLGHEVVGFDPNGARDAGGIDRAATEEEAVQAADAVVVASPSALHADQAVAALSAGRPVLVEKPLATSVADAERVERCAAESGMVCGVAMNLRFHPAIVCLRDLIASGRLGTPYLAQASMGFALPKWRPSTDYRDGFSGKAALGGGIVWEAIHELDYLIWMLGPVTRVSGEASHVSDLEIDVEDVAVAVLRFAAGTLGAVDLNFVEPVYRRGCVIVGSRAVARWDWNEGAIALQHESGAVETIDVAADVADTYLAVMRDFLLAGDRNVAPRTPLAEAVVSVRVASALHASAATGRAVAVA
jgi:predicted dehydrogenase